VRYLCSQCEYIATGLSNLKVCVARYPCSQCEYIATCLSNLNKHNGVRYPCYPCEYIATFLSNLKVHVENKHLTDLILLLNQPKIDVLQLKPSL